MWLKDFELRNRNGHRNLDTGLSGNFAHNRPSGDAEPSCADELLTKRLKEALALVDIRVLDHTVVVGTEAVSLAERQIL